MADRTGSRRPLVVQEPEITRGLVARFQIAHLLKRYPERRVWALFMFLNGFATIALLARQTTVLVPTAIASTALLLLSGGLLWYVVSFDARLRHWSRRG